MENEVVQQFIAAGLIHSVHTSERKAFRACRWRWDKAYRQKYQPFTMPKPLEFGIAWHVAMETWYDPDMWDTDRETHYLVTVETFIKVIADQLKRYEEYNGAPDDETLKDYVERRDLGVKMLEYYCKRVSPMLDKGLTPLAVEIPFEVYMGFECKCPQCWRLWTKSEMGIKHHDEWQVEKYERRLKLGYSEELARSYVTNESNYYEYAWDGLPVTFGGRIDAIFRDEQGRILVFDWKTTARILDGEDEAAFLQLDDQVGGYPVALYKLGRQVDGFIYHEQKKAVPEPPVPLKRAYKGCMYSTNKDAPVEYMTYLETVMNQDTYAFNNGLYDKYLQHLSGPMAPKFYQRHTIFKTDTQMDNFWEDLILEAKDMLNDPSVYAQPSRFSCNSCLFRQPCEGRLRGEDYQITLDTMYVKD